MGINSSKKQERVIEIKPSFLAILFSTLVLIVGLVIALFVVMNIENKDIDDSPSTKKGSSKTTQTAAPVSKNPLYVTKESRSSYKITTSGTVVMLTDEIGANNTVLVKVEKDSLTSVVEKGADEKIYPASMTKVMTLLVACENVTDLSKKLTVTKEIADYAAQNDGSGAGLKVGDSYTVEDLLYLLIYRSDTIASILIAEEIAGSEAAFVDMMNAKVAQLGLTGTHFANCTGLYDANNYSTCKDIASIMVYAFDNEMAYKCLTTYTGRPMVVGGVDCTFYSAWYSGKPEAKNSSLGFSDDPRINSSTKIIAGKTGYVDEAGFTFVTVSEDRSGQRYVNVTIGKPKGQGYTAKLFMDDVKKIYSDYAK